MEKILLFATMFAFLIFGIIIGILIGEDLRKQEENKNKNTLSLGEMQELSNKHEQVDENLFVLLADSDREFAFRKELVDQYGYRANATFFSDGSVFVNNHGKGVTGWVGRTPPVSETPPT